MMDPAEVVDVFEHPQGKRITIYADGTWECRGPDGKKKTTSATPAKLRAGHGTWVRVGP
jgi:hypothetical protein